MGGTYFISDLHLGAGAYSDPRVVEALAVSFLRSIKDTAEALYLLGDVIDYWYEYRNCVPQGFVRFFGALAELADAGVKVRWYVGNHDVWLYHYLSKEIGMEVRDPRGGGEMVEIDGVKFYLGHGDGVGPQGLFMRVARPVFRSRMSRALYGAVHPRWTIGFARWWSRRSREAGESGYESESDRLNCLQGLRERLGGIGRELCAMHPGLRYIIIGHYHTEQMLRVNDTCHLCVLGGWNEKEGHYGLWDGDKMTLRVYKLS